MKTVRKIAIAVAPILVLGLMGVLVRALSDGRGDRAGGSLSPEETVVAFNRYMLAGDVDSAGRLCTEQMSWHIGRFREAWDEIERQDSAVCSAAERLLGGVDIHISGTEKTGNGRTAVHYRLTSPISGHEEKIKVAELVEHKLHGGEGSVWRIEKIRDGEEN